MGIGARLVSMMREQAGRDCSVVLLSSPSAAGFYENMGRGLHSSTSQLNLSRL